MGKKKSKKVLIFGLIGGVLGVIYGFLGTLSGMLIGLAGGIGTGVISKVIIALVYIPTTFTGLINEKVFCSAFTDTFGFTGIQCASSTYAMCTVAILFGFIGFILGTLIGSIFKR